MASVSNINGIFDVHSTGAIQFNGNHGTAGQILKSNGNAAPTWVAASTVIGGPYLPVSGGTLTGATATASGISFTVGGALTAGSLAGPGSAITALNASNLTSGTVALARMNKVLPTSGNYVWSASSLASTYNVGIQTAFVAAAQGWPNYGAVLHVGARGGSDAGGDYQIYCGHGSAYGGNHLRFRNADNDATPSDSWTGWKTIWDSVNLPNPVQSSGVTSVATGTGLTGGTITTTGTLSIDSTVATLAGSQTFTGNKYFNNFFLEFNSKTLANFNDLNNNQFDVSMYDVYNLATASTGMLSTYGTLFQINGRTSHTKTQFAFNGGNDNLQYRTSWYPNTAWTSFRQIWDSDNLPNPVQGGPYLPLAGGTMTGSLNMGSQSITGATNIYNSAWFRNSNSSEGLYNSSTGNHWYSQGGFWDTGLNGTQGIRLRNGHNGAIMGYLYSETSGQFGLLDKDGNWTLRTDGDTITELRCNNAVGFQMDASGYLTFPVNLNLGTTAPTKVFMSNNAQVKTCDLATARAQFNLAYSTFRRFDYTTDTDYSTNIVGWATMNLNSTIPGYGSGFWDQWATAGADGQPSNETSHWQGSQAFHYVRRSDLGNMYGYQTALGAGDPAKMYVRGIWGGSSWGSWYRMHNDKTALIKINNQISISTYNDQNLKIQGASSSAAGITGYAGNGGHVWQIYGSGNDYGFLNGNWAAWDLRKTKNGNLYLNNQSTYYLNPQSASIFNDVRANIYYDQANTAYYTRPATSSYINTLHTAGQIQVGSSGSSQLYLGNTSGNYFRFHTNNADTYFDANVGNIYWRQGSSTRFYFYMTTANMTINGSLTQNSDVRVKENIIEISNCIDKVKAIRGVYYNRTDFNTKATKVGVIAQEVEKVLPEVILEAPDTGLKSVAYAELTPVLINAIKEQQVMIDDLKSRLKELENK